MEPFKNYIPGSSFFEDAISTWPTLAGMEDSLSTFHPRVSTATTFPEDSRPQHAALPTHDGQQEELYPLQILPDIPVKLKYDISEPITDTPNGRKHDRKRRGQQKTSDKMKKLEDSKVKVRIKDSRRRRLLERNRISATKCRIRKRDEALALAAREQEMEERNQRLSRTLEELTTESYHLKIQLLRHSDCDCTLIHNYIAHEARKSVQGLSPDPSPFRSNVMPLPGDESGSTESRSSINDTSVTDLYGIPTLELEDVLPTWPDPSLPSSSSPEAIFNMTMKPIQKEISQLISCMPSMHNAYYPGL